MKIYHDIQQDIIHWSDNYSAINDAVWWVYFLNSLILLVCSTITAFIVTVQRCRFDSFAMVSLTGYITS